MYISKLYKNTSGDPPVFQFRSYRGRTGGTFLAGDSWWKLPWKSFFVLGYQPILGGQDLKFKKGNLPQKAK